MAKVFILWPRIFGFDSDWFDSGWYTSHFSERWYRILGRHGITKTHNTTGLIVLIWLGV